MLNRYLLPCSLIASLLLLPVPAQSVQCSTSKCYLDVYNSVDEQALPVIERVRAIHSNLVKIIGSREAVRSKLIVINSTGYPWAVALSDNTVVITKGAIESIYRGVTRDIADARIAFVQARPEEELRADLRGYIFASIAGYRTDLLLGGEQGFFSDWMQQISPNPDSKTHPDNSVRVQFIEKGFQNILDNLPYYWFSVALAHFGNYTDAQYLLEDNLNIVETEFAYSNLGYIHIQTKNAIREFRHIERSNQPIKACRADAY